MNLKQLLSTAAVLILVLIFGSLSVVYWPHSDESPSEPAAEYLEPPGLVKMSQRKQAFAGIRTTEVRRQSFPILRSLPARFAYDDTRHVAVRSPTAGILKAVLVKQGDRVEAGEVLAVVRSPAVGAARSKLLQSAAERELAATRSDWQATVHAGVKRLVALIRRGDTVDSIKKQLGKATLGRYRSDLLGKYSRLLLSEKRLSSASGIRESGAISGSILQERQSEQEQAKAELEAAIEQALYEAGQMSREAQSKSKAAERDLLVARQELATVLASNVRNDESAQFDREETDLAELKIRSPLNGTIERRDFSATERVAADDELFIVADTRQLWVEADLRGGDWSVIHVKPGQEVEVSTPAVPDRVTKGTVYFVGREVDPETGTVPLVAQVDNASGLFRPGLFARMEVPVGEVADVLAVPERALINVDGAPSVFVADGKGFRHVPLELGRRSAALIEVRSGLQEGQRVVDEGAFALKSELLLAGEE